MNSERERAQALYGVVSREEYEAAMKSLPALSVPDAEEFRTFREDYGVISREEGEVIVHYEGGCTKCGLHVGIEESKRFWSRGDPDGDNRGKP